MLEFSLKGIYKDNKMPTIDEFVVPVMGIWETQPIDVSPAFDILEKINSGRIGYFSHPFDKTDIEVYTSVDGETWQGTKEGFIENAVMLNNNPFIKLKVVIRYKVAQITKEESMKLSIITIILSDKNYKEWSTEIPLQLKWGDNDDGQ